VVDLAQRNSSAVKLANADLQKAQAALAQTEDAYIPNFRHRLPTVGYSHGFPTGQPSVGNATMQSLVLSFSQRQYTKAARAGVEAANLSLKDAKEQVALDASTAYIELDTVNRELKLRPSSRMLHRRLVAFEQQRTEAGVDSDLDLLQARLKPRSSSSAPSSRDPRRHAGQAACTCSPACPSAPSCRITPAFPEIPAVTADEAPAPLPGIDPQAPSRAPSSSRPRETTWPGAALRSDSAPSTTTIPMS
jgi:hypothetical protein